MLKHTLYPSKGNRRRFMNIYFENIHKRIIFAPQMNQWYEPITDYIQHTSPYIGKYPPVSSLHCACTLVQRLCLDFHSHVIYYPTFILPTHVPDERYIAWWFSFGETVGLYMFYYKNWLLCLLLYLLCLLVSV